MAAAVGYSKDNMIKADRLAAKRKRTITSKMRRASLLDDRTRAFEAKVSELGRRIVVGIAVMEETAQSMSSTARPPTARPAGSAAASEQTSANVQMVASATEERTSSIAEIGRQARNSTRSPPRRRERPAALATPRARCPRARKRSATSSP